MQEFWLGWWIFSNYRSPWLLSHNADFGHCLSETIWTSGHVVLQHLRALTYASWNPRPGQNRPVGVRPDCRNTLVLVIWNRRSLHISHFLCSCHGSSNTILLNCNENILHNGQSRRILLTGKKVTVNTQ